MRSVISSCVLTHLRIGQRRCFVNGHCFFPSIRDVPEIDSGCYEVVTCRGSGPGGQGANSSSSKVELRVDLTLLHVSLLEHEDTLVPLPVESETIYDMGEDESGVGRILRALAEGTYDVDFTKPVVTSEGKTLLFSSNEQRSAYQNQKICEERLRRVILAAAVVKPVQVTRAQQFRPSTATITKHKIKRQVQSNKRRAQQAVRKGLW